MNGQVRATVSDVDPKEWIRKEKWWFAVVVVVSVLSRTPLLFVSTIWFASLSLIAILAFIVCSSNSCRFLLTLHRGVVSDQDDIGFPGSQDALNTHVNTSQDHHPDI